MFYITAVQTDKYYKQKARKKEECLIRTAIKTEKNYGYGKRTSVKYKD